MNTTKETPAFTPRDVVEKIVREAIAEGAFDEALQERLQGIADPECRCGLSAEATRYVREVVLGIPTPGDCRKARERKARERDVALDLVLIGNAIEQAVTAEVPREDIEEALRLLKVEVSPHSRDVIRCCITKRHAGADAKAWSLTNCKFIDDVIVQAGGMGVSPEVVEEVLRLLRVEVSPENRDIINKVLWAHRR